MDTSLRCLWPSSAVLPAAFLLRLEQAESVVNTFGNVVPGAAVSGDVVRAPATVASYIKT
jgi:hypothetical protein